MTITMTYHTSDKARLIVDEMTFSGKNARTMAAFAREYGENMGYIVIETEEE